MVAAVGSEMSNRRFRALRVRADPQGDQRLEQRPQQRSVLWSRHRPLVAVQQRCRSETEQGCGQRRIGQVVLGSGCELTQVALGGLPSRERIEDEQPFQHASVRFGGAAGGLVALPRRCRIPDLLVGGNA